MRGRVRCNMSLTLVLPPGLPTRRGESGPHRPRPLAQLEGPVCPLAQILCVLFLSYFPKMPESPLFQVRHVFLVCLDPHRGLHSALLWLCLFPALLRFFQDFIPQTLQLAT